MISNSDYIFSPSEDFTAATAHESFKKLLDFLLISELNDDQEGDVVWKLDPAPDPTAEINPIAQRANVLDKLIKDSIPEEETFFDLDLQDDLPQLKILKQSFEKTMKDWNKSGKSLILGSIKNIKSATYFINALKSLFAGSKQSLSLDRDSRFVRQFHP